MSIPPNKSNMGQSVFTRLLNIAKQSGETHQYLLTRYAIERLLYRLSISEYAEQFILKGGTLLLAWQGKNHRVTRDVDFLGIGTSRIADIKQIFKTICLIPTIDDGVIFLPERMMGEEIMENKRYAGARITLIAQIYSAKQTIQVDIGFGDVIIPRREKLAYPSQLDMPAPQLWVYPKYTVIAEKFETMISLGIINSRLKDFYDVWLMARLFDFEGEILKQAIKSTFERRNRPLPANTPSAFTPEFYADKDRVIQWGSFIKRDIINQTGEIVTFTEVIQSIQSFIMPVIESSKQDQSFNAIWSKANLAWAR
jgi:hypothetical protein